MPRRPLFSILHPSARPDAWRSVYDDWMAKCRDKSRVEYLLGADERWGFVRTSYFNPDGIQVVWNKERKCYVDAVNNLALHARGGVLIVIADDQFAFDGWDEALEKLIPEQEEFVIQVSTGTPGEVQRRIMVMPILSASRHERLGYVFYPAYESMYADNDFCEQAEADRCVVDATALMFPHKHFLFTPGVNADAAYLHQNRDEALQLGKAIFAKRRENGFTDLKADISIRETKPQKYIALCCPGETFSTEWVLALWEMRTRLYGLGYTPILYTQYTSNVYHTRVMLAQAVLQDPRNPEFVLWMDNDNIATADQAAMLLDDLLNRPDDDVMAGWCWIHNPQTNVFYPSCGIFNQDRSAWYPFEMDFVQGREITGIECTGFPFVMMRRSALERAGGQRAFLPILNDRSSVGVMGEDHSWCMRALDAGVNLCADPRVKVLHLKTRSAEPFFAPAPAAAAIVNRGEPRIAGMLRVKNEGRWIRRVIESILPLCDCGVFLLDDGSTDGTADIAYEVGAAVKHSPFIGEPLDEARDKNWLLDQITERMNPDWIFCIDGDEELERGGAEKIRQALRSAAMSCYALRFYYLWDKEFVTRWDRWYREFSRYSIFRPLPEHRFKSLYAGAGVNVHSGLHTGNAPGDMASGAVIDGVRLLHYGYMLREDRVRKYAYYNEIDPNNEIEDCYRHMVQGDLPEVPAGATLKYAGPLELVNLPEDIWPAPLDLNAESVRRALMTQYPAMQCDALI